MKIMRMLPDSLKALVRKPASRSRWRQCALLIISLLGLGALASAPVLAQGPTAQDFQRVVVAEGLDLPMEFEISTDGRIFIVSKCGALYAWNLDTGVPTQTATVANVRCVFEDGLLSVALDPDFTQNHYIYFQYTAPGSRTRVSRYVVNPDNSLDMNSESILLEWITGSEAHGHMGGSLKFDLDGNLLISTGDNQAATGYFSPAAQATSGNTNDLRGKILRIKPTPAGGYTIPAGNLFAGDAQHRPEIYGMGFRNPFRINLDPLTGYFYTGDIGPDASAASAEGPEGMDEIHEIRAAGNYGWPWIVGFNQPYAGFDPNNLINSHANNTGATQIPNAIPAIWTIRHQATMVGPVYRFNEAVQSEFKLPAFYDGKLIFWDFNSSQFFTLDLSANQTPPVAVDFPLNTAGFQGAIDAELDPRTHQLYVLQWGSGCCDKEPYGGGALYRFDYIGDRSFGNNLSTGATAYASSEVGPHRASNVLDGDPTSRWESDASDPQVLNIELQQDSTIGAIVLTWEAAYSSKYLIEGSLDGVVWETLVEENNGAGGLQLHMINSEKSYRYIRLTGLERGTTYGHSLFEFEIYAGKDDQPPVELTEFAYLNMPRTLDAGFTGVPRLLSETGVFSDTATMTPAPHLLPFTPNTALWSDRAEKSRWLSLPANTKIGWDAKANWTYPEGSITIKTFELPVNPAEPSQTKRLETRLLVMKADGKVYGVTYKWRADNSDADLMTDGLMEPVALAGGGSQTWAYPSPTQCIECHTPSSAQMLGLSTRQLNGDYNYPGVGVQNQLVHWNNLNLFSPAFNNAQVAGFDKMVAITDENATLENRIKSYIDANCAHCHGTGMGGSQWDGRYNTPLSQMKIVNENTTGIRNYLNYYGIANAKVIDAGNPHQSIFYIRDKSEDPDDRMPPVGRLMEHTEYIHVLERWINSLANGQPGGEKTLLSAGKSVRSLEEEIPFVSANVVDSDLGTRWSSGFTDDQWIEIDLGSVQAISEIVLVWEAAYGSAYRLEGSLDQNTWHTIADKTNGAGGIEVFDNLSVSWRYVRMQGVSRATPWGYSLYEFEIWGGSDAPVPTLSVVSPQAAQVLNEGTDVELQVAVSAGDWFNLGGSYRYSLNGAAGVLVSNSATVNLGVLPAGQYSLNVQLVSAAGQNTGTARTVAFTVNASVAPESVLLSQNKPATSSDIEGDYVATNATDGNSNTRWASAHEDNQFIQIDLGSRVAVTDIVLEWEAAYGSGYVIEVSDDGNVWREIFSTTTGLGGTETLTINGEGRYVRLTGTVRATPYGFSLWEFQVFGHSLEAAAPQISIVAPLAGQTFAAGSDVNLQVSVNDADWFSNGGSYRYSLNGAAAVSVTQGGTVNLGVLAAGNHSMQVTLLNAQGQVAGQNRTVNFSVMQSGGSGSEAVPPAKLSPTGVDASSQSPVHTAANVIDGNATTRWESDFEDPQYITLDLGENMYFTRAVLTWEAAYGRSYTIDVSVDGNTWQNAYTTAQGRGGVEDIVLDGEQGRYIRMRGTERVTSYGYSLFSFDVYGLPADPAMPLISIVSPTAEQSVPNDDDVTLQVGITDSAWMANGGSYNYSLNNLPAVNVNSPGAINLGVLPTGGHTVRVSLVDSNGVEVSVPKLRKFKVSCGNNCPNILVFSKTAGFRHDSIPAGIAMVQAIGAEHGYNVTLTEDSSLFTTTNLAQYTTVVFMNTTGDVFDANQEAAFQTYIENGGGYVGTHAAADTEHDWVWYTDVLFAGAEFIHHGDGIPHARVEIEQPNHHLVNHMGSEWFLADEWYFWKSNPRGVGNINVLANLDRSSYNSAYPVEDHPIIFTNEVGAGRMFYTAVGHVDANFTDPKMVENFRKAIEWTSGL